MTTTTATKSEQGQESNSDLINPLEESRIAYLLHLADCTLVLSQRNSEWCGHGPVLDQDIAITNISLDLLGQARNFYQYAAKLMGGNWDENRLAYFRTEREFKNILLTELPKGDWGQTILRQFFFSQYQYLLFEKLQHHPDEQLAAITSKALKEVKYHLRWSREWVIRLGDGTEESARRMKNAVSTLWQYTGEMFMPESFETAIGAVNMEQLKQDWETAVTGVFVEATLQIPGKEYMHSGGKKGIHTEHMGFLLAELQYIQRAYPNCEW